MKVYRVIVSGCQVIHISAANEDEAEQRVSDYMVDNSVLRYWEVGIAEEVSDEDDPDDFDIRIEQEE